LPELIGIDYRIAPFYSNRTFNLLYKKGFFIAKLFGTLSGFIKRIFLIFFNAPFYSFIFIHREAAPIGPPIFEWLLAKLFRKKIIYDFDDAIWISKTTEENKFAGWMKASWKVKFICKWSYKVVCGNEYLCNYAKQFAQTVICIPTCVNTDVTVSRIKNHVAGNNVVGWTGSHSTTTYLNGLSDVLLKLEKEDDVRFLVISNKPPGLPLNNLTYCTWKEETEIEDLLKMDIGIMPMVKDQWSEGKCGFKLIQYLSLGIPAVTSPVGVNKKIIEHGVNGFLCETEAEWGSALKKLLADVELRKQMGLAGRKIIQQRYSVQSQKEKFIELFS
jgi:glycosyltransferase involved in cell wall biosynthesis